MKRLIFLVLALAMLCGCGGAPAETTMPVETTLPPETTALVETTAPEETTIPVEAAAPIRVVYAEEDFNPYEAYWSDETDYITSLGFVAEELLTDVEFSLLTWNDGESYDVEVLYAFAAMDPDRPFLAQVTFWGDMTTYGIAFTDASGARRHFAVMVSGKDGSLICQEYVP